jgi:hypothetical protein
VLGDTYVSYDLGDEEGLLVMGSSGILYVEEDHMRHEQMLSAYLFLYSLSTFIRNYFNRTFILGAYATLRYATLRYAMLCYAMLCVYSLVNR